MCNLVQFKKQQHIVRCFRCVVPSKWFEIHLQCKRAAQLKQQMVQMFNNDLPVMIEVLVYPSCCHGKDQEFATTATSGPPGVQGILLEQWTIQILPKRSIFTIYMYLFMCSVGCAYFFMCIPFIPTYLFMC